MNPVIWGSFMVVLGILLLLERLAGLHLPEGTLWPMILFVIGVTQIAKRRFGSALMFMLLAGVFLACTLGWYGMTYAKSWPLLLIAVGLGMVVNTLTCSARTLGFEIRNASSSDHESSGS